ncbi:hypothetical protein [uncultured Pontibacter sp.]|uniref:hypothetical protein n=1 Tax=uncultured Pontibacter sp. TaxID=453356 RepID=UPI002616373B|nr:hypothetical protein [uncultured Pontibacter sp.]
MKKLLVMTCMMFGCAFTAAANGDTKPAVKKTSKVDKKVALVAEQRANHLSNKMIIDLGLNNYQSRKIREINNEVVAKKLAVETEFAGNQAVIDKKCEEICNVRDIELESVLSTRQYNEYFGARKVYNQAEQEFMASLDVQDNATAATETPVAVTLN